MTVTVEHTTLLTSQGNLGPAAVHDKSSQWPTATITTSSRPLGRTEDGFERLLSRVCDPFVEQMLEAVGQAQDLVEKSDDIATSEELDALSCAIQEHLGGIKKHVKGVTEALQAEPVMHRTVSVYDVAECDALSPQANESANFCSEDKVIDKEEMGAEPSTDNDSTASECKASSSQISSTTEQGDVGYQADSDEIEPIELEQGSATKPGVSTQRAKPRKIHRLRGSRAKGRGLRWPIISRKRRQARARRGMSGSERSAISRDSRPDGCGEQEPISLKPDASNAAEGLPSRLHGLMTKIFPWGSSAPRVGDCCTDVDESQHPADRSAYEWLVEADSDESPRGAARTASKLTGELGVAEVQCDAHRRAFKSAFKWLDDDRSVPDTASECGADRSAFEWAVEAGPEVGADRSAYEWAAELETADSICGASGGAFEWSAEPNCVESEIVADGQVFEWSADDDELDADDSQSDVNQSAFRWTASPESA